MAATTAAQAQPIAQGGATAPEIAAWLQDQGLDAVEHGEGGVGPNRRANVSRQGGGIGPDRPALLPEGLHRLEVHEGVDRKSRRLAVRQVQLAPV